MSTRVNARGVDRSVGDSSGHPEQTGVKTVDLPELLTKQMILQHFLPCGKRSLERWIAAGRFPEADVAFGGKVRYWRKATVMTWIDAGGSAGLG